MYMYKGPVLYCTVRAQFRSRDIKSSKSFLLTHDRYGAIFDATPSRTSFFLPLFFRLVY